MAKEGGPGGPSGRGRGRRGKEEDRSFLGDMPTARLRPRSPHAALVAWLRHAGGTVQGGQGLRGANVLEVSSDPSS